MAGIKHKLESGESEEGSSEEEEDVWAGMETIGEKKGIYHYRNRKVILTFACNVYKSHKVFEVEMFCTLST